MGRTLAALPVAATLLPGGLPSTDDVEVLECLPRQVLFQQGDELDAVYFIESGQFKLSVVSARGQESVLATPAANAFFGEACMAGEGRAPYSAVALAQGKVLRLSKAAMQKRLSEDAAFASLFLAHVVATKRDLEHRVLELHFSTAEERLANTLIEMAQGEASNGLLPIEPRPSHDMLAAMVGTTRPRVSVFMNRFRRHGFVAYSRTQLLVHPALAEFIQDANARGGDALVRITRALRQHTDGRSTPTVQLRSAGAR